MTLAHPDLSDRPHALSVEREMQASPGAIYRAWTEGFDSWFAERGQIQMRAEEGQPFVFHTRHEDVLHPHYGRFLTLQPHRLVELTWMTGKLGTAGAETVVTVELTPAGTGTRLRLTHAGFYDQEGVDRHETAWERHVLPRLEAAILAEA